MSINVVARKLLWGRAGNQCAWHSCSQRLTVDLRSPESSVLASNGAVLGEEARCLVNDASDGDEIRWLFPGFDIKLFSDEGEGYYLNISSATPCWFIMWRIEQIDAQEVAVPKAVTLSYNEAARLMDGGEQVDTLPASATIIERLSRFTQEHYQPEVKRKRKKPSFEGGAGVDLMARAEGKRDGGR